MVNWECIICKAQVPDDEVVRIGKSSLKYCPKCADQIRPELKRIRWHAARLPRKIEKILAR